MKDKEITNPSEVVQAEVLIPDSSPDSAPVEPAAPFPESTEEAEPAALGAPEIPMPEMPTPVQTMPVKPTPMENTYTEDEVAHIRESAYIKGRTEAFEEVRRQRVAYYRNLRDAGARAEGRMPDSKPDTQFLATPRQGFWD